MIFGTDMGISIHVLASRSLSHRGAQRCVRPPLPAAPTIAAPIAAPVVRCGWLAVRPPLCSCTWHGSQRLLVVVVTEECATQPGAAPWAPAVDGSTILPLGFVDRASGNVLGWG